MKTMAGDFERAALNSSRTRFAPTPTYSSSNSEPDMKKKGTPASPATARASNVLPVPGGPVSSTPFGSLPPSPVNLAGSFKKSTISSSSLRASSTPSTSLNLTVDFSPRTWSILLPFGPPPGSMPPPIPRNTPAESLTKFAPAMMTHTASITGIAHFSHLNSTAIGVSETTTCTGSAVVPRLPPRPARSRSAMLTSAPPAAAPAPALAADAPV